jgi:hypothetical protein
MTDFDITLASLKNKDLFVPFRVRAMRRLQEALATCDVHRNAPVLVLERDGGTLVLLTHQMSYHHVAQGEMAGRPWMVSF